MPNISIIGSEKSGKTSLAKNLGKKGTESDIILYNSTKGDRIYTFVESSGYPESLKSLIQAINLSDIVLLCIPSSGLSAETGECIIALDLLGNKKGMFVITMSDKSNLNALSGLSDKIKAITKGTKLETWEINAISTTTFDGMEKLKEKIYALGEDSIKSNSKLDSLPIRVVIDHFFNVTGIGCVVLGNIMQGTLNVHDKLTVFPIDRETEIRSIQSNDVNVKSASTSTRVGLALKSVQSKELDRGYIISQKEEVSSKLNLKCHLTKFTKEIAMGDAVHIYIELQTTPAKVEKISIDGKEVAKASSGSVCDIVLTLPKPIAYNKNDRVLIVNLNNPKQRVVAGCNII